MTTNLWKRTVMPIGAAALALMATAASAQTTITIGSDGEHPESITTGRDGTLFIGSWGKSAVYRVTPGATSAEPFITEGLDTVAGVFASGDTLWVCSSAGISGDGPAAARAYDIASGDLKGSYDFPGGGFCNDFAVGRDGTLFASDTSNARILALKPGELEFTVFAEDADLLAGVDGLAILDGELIANSVTQSTIIYIEITPDFGFGGMHALPLSQPVEGPDGMRALANDQGILLIEGNRLDMVTLDSTHATITVLQDGFDGATGVTERGHMAYVVEGKLAYLFNADMGDPGAFNAIPVPLP